MHVIDLKLPESFREREMKIRSKPYASLRLCLIHSQISQQDAILSSEAQQLPFPIQNSYCKAMRYK